MGSYKNCKKSDCYVAKIEEKYGGVFLFKFTLKKGSTSSPENWPNYEG